jgi:alpha-tubulin suppressor-like RCC1 family protein
LGTATRIRSSLQETAPLLVLVPQESVEPWYHRPMVRRGLSLVVVVVWAASCLRVGFEEHASGPGDAATEAGQLDQGRDLAADTVTSDAAGSEAAVTDASPPKLDKGAPDASPLVFPPGEKLSAGGWHTCAIRLKGAVYCWGDNSDGVLGDGTTNDSLKPVEVKNLSDAVDVEASEQHTCAVRSTGAVVCWGENANHALGVSSVTKFSAVPVQVTGIANAVSVDAGWDHTCAVLSTGEVMCWGDNYFGECGGTKGGNKPSPVKVSGISDAVEIDSGEDFTCARRAGGQVVCWGTYTGSSSSIFPPTTVSGISDAVELGAGSNHACAVRSTGAVVCWGNNSGLQLGVSQAVVYAYTTTPVTVGKLTGAVEVMGGQVHTCARHASGEVSCWGWNAYGNLGRGLSGTSLSETEVPGKVLNLSDAQQLSSTEDFTCALRKTGAVVCWGDNYSGQLGDGTKTGRTSPVAVQGLP